jgi:hypothetical protein
MRQFQSSAQVDTYLIQFSPGRVDGGDYPMKFAWSHRQIDSLYGGTVLLQDRLGMVVDMKSSDTSIVTNANITSLLLIAQHPILPPEAVDRGSAAVPREFALEQNYPNPFNPVTTIRYDLPTSSNVSLVVYNLLGQEVSILRIGVESPGYKAVRWDASSRPSGIYFIRLRASSTTLPLKSFVEVRKMVVLK